MSWSASQYSKFEDQRNRPIIDLLAHLPDTQVETAADIGCGPGNSTEFLRDRYPQATLLGMDSSTDMIEAARRRLPDVAFEVDDIAIWANPGPFDVILANAALQWVEDHETLIPNLIGKLAPGGSLAVQVPDNLDEPARRLMYEVAAEGAWSVKLETARQSRAPRRSVDWYYRLLRGLVPSVDIWRTVYHHRLAEGPDGVIEWFKGTSLRPFLEPLDPDEQAAYLERYRDGVASAYPAQADGSVLLPFPRLFFIATR